ncbi:hypothetical protein [Sphingomonas koreensis]|uniref:hypothetical protein n=1 Tax=Sphingomonas koreensis TaxID=93064 RepID=UPI000F7DE509|nr:hypothetical protein [Sphingomonas koreensis]RSU21222.1 hypothetical protein CA224_06890 [Sphingomonas koreensis]RSU32213.1 hypothetical protein CA225_02595 [Sphingomonas koreensis]RSU35707.1 hypothetical protein BRX39_08765 [Sphingomonas koreensis]RSU49878.1 hypothetical protein CA221_12385 [Sphingomonas koreensis]RSU83473.1 hypothetical protein CA253_21240 [Sphingomonas koreensis]
MKRRTFNDIDAHARAHERVSFKQHVDTHIRRLTLAVKRGDISQDAADVAVRQLRMFGDDALTGLHVDDHSNPKIRGIVRMMLAQGGQHG